MAQFFEGLKRGSFGEARKKYSLITFIVVSINELVKGGTINDNYNMATMGSVINIIIKFRH